MSEAQSGRPDQTLDKGAAPPKLPRTVVALGWVSLLTDAASDMTYPLVPELLRSIGGGASWLGWFEGVAEVVSTGLKLVSGRLSDNPKLRKPLIAMGYGIAALSKPLLALVSTPLQAVLVRAVDRVGKGLRGPPRDAMVAGAVSAEHRGHAFGFHRMMDNFGGALGPILAFLLMFLGVSLREVFVFALIPGLLAVLVVLQYVRDPSQVAQSSASTNEVVEKEDKPKVSSEKPKLPHAAKRYLIALFVFSLAASGDLFLLRRMADLGLDPAILPLAWMLLQFGKGLLNVPGGRLSDKLGRKRVLALSWVLYAAIYAGFGLATSGLLSLVLFGLYAAHYGLAEGGQRAIMAELVPAEIRGRAYGIQLAVEGGGIFLANVAFGYAYEHIGAPTAFTAAGIIALLGAALLWLIVPSPRKTLA